MKIFKKILWSLFIFTFTLHLIVITDEKIVPLFTKAGSCDTERLLKTSHYPCETSTISSLVHKTICEVNRNYEYFGKNFGCLDNIQPVPLSIEGVNYQPLKTVQSTNFENVFFYLTTFYDMLISSTLFGVAMVICLLLRSKTLHDRRLKMFYIITLVGIFFTEILGSWDAVWVNMFRNLLKL